MGHNRYIPESRTKKIREYRDAFDAAAYRLSNVDSQREMTLAVLAAQLSEMVDAIRILLMKGRAGPAMATTRSLYELALWIAFILDTDEEDRSDHYKAASAASSRIFARKMEEMRWPVSTETREAIQRRGGDPRAQEYLEFRLVDDPEEGPNRDYMIARLSDLETKAMFRRYDQWIFRPASAFVHGAAAATTRYLGQYGIETTEPMKEGVDYCYISTLALSELALKAIAKHPRCDHLEHSVSLPRYFRIPHG